MWLVLLFLLPVISYAQDITSLTTYVNSQLPNNTTRQITPANVRNSVLAYPNNQFVSSSYPVTTTSYVTATTYYGDGSHLTGITGGSSTTPGGTSGSIQFNNGTNNTLGGGSGFTTDGSNVSSTGYVSASGGFYGDGSHLTGIAGSSVSWTSITGVPAGVTNISNSTGSVTATTFTGTNLGGTLTTAAQPNITSLGSLTGLTVNGTGTFTTVSATQAVNTVALSASTVLGTLQTASQPNVTGLGTQASFVATSGTIRAGSLISATIGNFGSLSATTLAGDCSLCTNIPSGGTPQSIVSNTTRVDARNDGTISLTTGGVVTGYFDASGRLIVPGISVTTNQTSVTTLLASGLLTANSGISASGAVTVTSVSGSATGLTLIGNTNNFYQLNMKNTANGSSASTDYVATADNGTDTTHYVDFGINGSGGASAPFTSANTAYMYSTDSELDIGALGSGGLITFNVSGGTATPTEKARITANGISTTNVVALGNISATGGISATNFQGNGALLTGINGMTISATQNHPSTSIYVGFNSGGVVTAGTANATLGDGALASGTTANSNVAIGAGALASTTTAASDVAVGHRTLESDKTGGSNVAVGDLAAGYLLNPSSIVAIGSSAGYGGNGSNPAASVANSVFIGAAAGNSVSGSSNNTFVGYRSGVGVTSGSSNTYIGQNAGTQFAFSTGSNNIALGSGAYDVSETASNQLNIGNSIYGKNLNSTPLIGINNVTPTTALDVVGVITASGGFTGALNTAAQTNVTSLGTLTALTVNGTVSASGPGILSGLWQLTSGTGTLSATVLNANTASFTTVNMGACTGAGCSSGGGTSVSTTTFTAASNISGSTDLGFNAAVGTGQSNTTIGARAGRSITTGNNTTAVGAKALDALNTAIKNTAVGSGALQVNQTGDESTAVGYFALNANTAANNTAVGSNAGAGLTTGSQNTFVGQGTSSVTTGGSNTFMGYQAGMGAATTSAQNTFLGSQAAWNNGVTGVISNSVAIGFNALANIGTGLVNDTVVGAAAGQLITTGSSNTLIGYRAGNNITTGVNNLVLGSGINAISATATNTLNIENAIYGNIGSGTGNANLIGINITSPTAALEVVGSVKFDTLASAAGTSYVCLDTTTSATSFSNTTCTVSDRKFKTNIEDYHFALDKVMAMRVREFEFKNPAYGKGKQVGLIAQEVGDVAPALVSRGTNGDLSVDYAKLSAYAVGAIQEQQKEINTLQQRLYKLEHHER